MKKILRFLFDTGYGAPLACLVAGALTMAGVLFRFWGAGMVMFLICMPLLQLSLLFLLVAFVRALVKRRWDHAAAQLVLGLLAALFCIIGLPSAVVGSWAAFDRWHDPTPWTKVGEPNGMVPFEVQYRVVSIFDFHKKQSVWERRVAFPSGNVVDLVDMDSAEVPGQRADLETYDLGGGLYVLDDRNGHRFLVDTADESIHPLAWGVVISAPGTVDPAGESVRPLSATDAPADGAPGTSRLLGRFVRPGKFVPAAADAPPAP